MTWSPDLRRARSTASRLLPVVLAAGLAACAVVFAREFRLDAIREFRFAWGTWAGAVVLAFGAGAIAASTVTARVRRAVAGLALLPAVAVLLHLPVVLAAGPGWHPAAVLATTSFVDGNEPQLLAAAVAGAAAATLGTRRAESARRRGVQPVE